MGFSTYRISKSWIWQKFCFFYLQRYTILTLWRVINVHKDDLNLLYFCFYLKDASPPSTLTMIKTPPTWISRTMKFASEGKSVRNVRGRPQTMSSQNWKFLTPSPPCRLKSSIAIPPLLNYSVFPRHPPLRKKIPYALHFNLRFFLLLTHFV